MEFTAVTNIFIRYLTDNDTMNFRKELDNSQILLFKSIEMNNSIYKLEQNKIHTFAPDDLLNMFNSLSIQDSFILFESNFIFEYCIRICKDHFFN